MTRLEISRAAWSALAGGCSARRPGARSGSRRCPGNGAGGNGAGGGGGGGGGVVVDTLEVNLSWNEALAKHREM